MKMTKALPDKRGNDQPEHADYLSHGGEPYDTVYCPSIFYPLILVAKLHEEVEEIRESLTDANEYADLIIVARSLAALNGVSTEAIDAAIAERKKSKGAFTLGKVMVRR